MLLESFWFEFSSPLMHLVCENSLIPESIKYVGLAVSGSRIFPRGVCQLPKVLLFFNLFAENCMKMKEFGPPGGASLAPPPWIRQWLGPTLGIGASWIGLVIQ